MGSYRAGGKTFYTVFWVGSNWMGLGAVALQFTDFMKHFRNPPPDLWIPHLVMIFRAESEFWGLGGQFNQFFFWKIWKFWKLYFRNQGKSSFSVRRSKKIENNIKNSGICPEPEPDRTRTGPNRTRPEPNRGFPNQGFPVIINRKNVQYEVV